MTRYLYGTALLLAASASPAIAADTSFSLTGDYTDFSKDFGSLAIGTAEANVDFGAAAVVVEVSTGTRKYQTESFSATQVSGSVYHDWMDRFSTRTTASISSNEAVFARRKLIQEFNFKIAQNVLLTGGARYSKYASGTNVKALSAGGTFYFKPGFVTYRFTRYDTSGLGNSSAHLLTMRLKDPGGGNGSMQIWLGQGSTLQQQDFVDLGRLGKYRSVDLRRVQPITSKFALNVGVGRGWYDNPIRDYTGTNVTIGLTLKSK
jgi:YaiO family outer membrane protein